MLVFFIVLALFIVLAVKGVAVWFSKLVVQIMVSLGAIYFFFAGNGGLGDLLENVDGLLFILCFLFYIIFAIAAIVAAAVWRMVDMSADEMKADFKQAMAMSKRCPRCLKKLPSYFTSKCPHCTADL